MKIKNFKKCLAGTLSFLMVSSITMLPASALEYPTDLQPAQINFSLADTVSPPTNNLAAMYNSKASGMASSAVRTNAGYTQQGTPSTYGMTGKDVYNSIGDKSFISGSGWQNWGMQNAAAMPDYNSLVASKQSSAEATYDSNVSEMPTSAGNAANMALSDLLNSNPTAALVYDNAYNDYASTSLAKATQNLASTTSLDGFESALSTIGLLQNFQNYNNSANVIANTTETGERTDASSLETNAVDSLMYAATQNSTDFSVSNASPYGMYNTNETEEDTPSLFSMPIFSYDSINWDTIVSETGTSTSGFLGIEETLTPIQQQKLEMMGITSDSPNYTAEYADTISSIDLKNKITEGDNALTYITGEGTNQEIFGFGIGNSIITPTSQFNENSLQNLRNNITTEDLKNIIEQRKSQIGSFEKYGNSWLSKDPSEQLASFTGVK